MWQDKRHEPARDSFLAPGASVCVTLVNYFISLIPASSWVNSCINNPPTSQLWLRTKESTFDMDEMLDQFSSLLPRQVPCQTPRRMGQYPPAEVQSGEGGGHLCKLTKQSGEMVLSRSTGCWGPRE